MAFQDTGRANMHRTDQWQSLVGEIVEVRLHGELYRRAVVDEAMPDASGLWLAPETVSQREFIDAASGFEVWTSLYPRSGWDTAAPASEMAAEAAESSEWIPARSGDVG
jgi:hypothetical protein